MKKSARAMKRIPGTTVKRGIPTRLGANMLKGQWTLISPNFLEFSATLVETVNIGQTRVAIFSVPKRSGRTRQSSD
jgi:hypothetical protein